MINPPWLDLHPSHLGAVQAAPLAKFLWFMKCSQNFNEV